MSEGHYDESPGCLAVVAVVALAIGAGEIWGEGVGWFTLGALCMLILVWRGTR